MDKEYKEIYDILTACKKLDSNTYNNLVLKYGQLLVDSVIEDMIDESNGKLSKFEYYVSNIVVTGEDVKMVMGYDAYMMDVSAIPCLSKEENRELALEIYDLVLELEAMFVKLGYYDVVDTSLHKPWVSDKVDVCISLASDSETLNKLNKLYKKFVRKRNALIEGNLRLVVAAVKKFFREDVSKEEIVQLGNLGFIRAVEKYNPNVGSSVSTYAYYWIRQSVNRGLAGIVSHLDVSYSLYNNNIVRVKAVRELTQILGREPTDEEVATYSGVDLDKIVNARIAYATPASLDGCVKAATSEDDKTTFGEFVADDSIDVEEQVFKKQMLEDVLSSMRDSLTEREMYVLMLRFGLHDGNAYTLENVGQQFGVTRERIRQIENKAIRKMRVRCKKLAVYAK